MKLFVCVPSHSGSMVMDGVQSIVQIQREILTRGGSLELRSQSGATISTVRNLLAAQFLESDADLLLMLDADQAISAEAVARMIDLNQPFVGCVYPMRAYNWSKVRFGAAKSLDDILNQASEFVGWLEEDAEGRSTVIDGFAKAVYVGTGILLLRREAFQRLKDHFPELEGCGFCERANPDHVSSGRWGFFNMMDDTDGVQMSEDISFCQRWRAAGGEIWADVTTSTAHIGPHKFSGNYFEYLKATGAD